MTSNNTFLSRVFGADSSTLFPDETESTELLQLGNNREESSDGTNSTSTNRQSTQRQTQYHDLLSSLREQRGYTVNPRPSLLDSEQEEEEEDEDDVENEDEDEDLNKSNKHIDEHPLAYHGSESNNKPISLLNNHHTPLGRGLNSHIGRLSEIDEEEDEGVPESLLVEQTPSLTHTKLLRSNLKHAHQNTIPTRYQPPAINETWSAHSGGRQPPNTDAFQPGIGHQPYNPSFMNQPTEVTHNFFHNKNTEVENDDERNRREKLGNLNGKERALWKWANVENLDTFLQDVYMFYIGNGLSCILLARVLDLLTLIFIAQFSTYLTMCIDYSKLTSSSNLNDIRVEQCRANMNGFIKFLLWIFTFYVISRFIKLILDIKKLLDLKKFYFYLLGFTDKELQTVSWPIIVQRIILLKDQNAITANTSDMKSKSRISAHDIANRIMRKENYMIAIFNKDILDLSLHLPFLNGKQILTKTLEWNLSLCILGFVFNEQGQLRPHILKESYRKSLSEELRRRFIIAGILNIILSPFIVTYFCLYYFFEYFNEYRKNPGSIGSRQYTPLAEWKLREFNELYHLFGKRLNLSTDAATKYIDQFPKEKTVLLLKFTAFIAGSFAAVLGVATILDPELLMGFEITKDRSVLFYITIFGTIWAVARGAIPSDNSVFDPEASLRHVARFTHYLPIEWDGKYHTEEVKKEFSRLYDLKVTIIIKEILSIVLTPFLLWFSLPNSSEKIIDFFREFSVHVDGLGYVCTFAMFNFEKNDQRGKIDGGIREDYYASKDGKMLKSYLYFLDSYANGQKTYPTANSNSADIGTGESSMYNTNKWQPNSEVMDPQSTSFYSDRKDLTVGASTSAHNRRSKRSRIPSMTSRGLEDKMQYSSMLADSFQSAIPRVDDSIYMKNVDEDDETEGGGVLGLLNQFYKHDGRKNSIV